MTTVEIASDQLWSVPSWPVSLVSMTRTHGPSAGSPTKAPSACSGWIAPVATVLPYEKLRTFGADGVPSAWSSNVVAVKTSAAPL